MKVKPFKLNYSVNDFKVVKYPKTNDKRIPFSFFSKDGHIEANFFWEASDVTTRGIVWDKSNIVAEFSFAYPFSNYRGQGVLPEPKIVLESIVRQLNRQNVKWLDSVPDE